jgi:serine/threonine protein kinase
LLEPGTILAGYRVDGVLGEGGMAIVYRATQLSLNREVALKLLSTQFGEDESFRERFKREGQMQAALDHRHIVAVYEAGESEQGLFLAMRLIPGPTLKELILGDQLDPRRTLRLLAQVAQALDTAHEAGLIHRDIKPQNILIDRDDHVYLADFGLTKSLDEESSLTAPGQFLGTIDYSAPEQIQGEAATAATDIYALTAVLYECLTGQVPFKENNEAAVLHAHIIKPPPKATDLRPELPAAIDEVVARGMAKDPTARPVSASELLREATRALASVPTVVSQTEQTRATETLGAGLGQVTRAGGAVSPTLPSAPSAETVASAPPDAKRRTSGAAIALVLALGVVAAVVGFAVGSSGSSKSTAKLVNTASVGHLQLRYPSGWQLGSSAASVPGLSFGEPLAIAATNGQASVTAGEVRSATGPTLLPASFREKVEGQLPKGEAVKLGALEGYRYEGVRAGGGALTLYTVPTTAGVATIACRGGEECGPIAATLRLVGATPEGLGPSAGYASRLTGVLGKLRVPLGALNRASTQAGQASAAQRIAHAFSTAARELAQTPPPPAAGEAHPKILAAVRGLSTAYGRLASAARSNDSGAYARAKTDVATGSGALQDALRGLRTLGYTLET